MKTVSKSFISILILIGFIVVSRLIPHWPNVTALGAVAILSPSWIKSKKLALLIPLLALFISDSIIGWHSTMIYTYFAMLLVSFVSYYSFQNHNESIRNYGLLAFNSSLIFFGISNFGAWQTLSMYPKTMDGLISSYWNAIPFLGFEFLGTIFYMVAILLSAELVRKVKQPNRLNL